MKKIPAHVRRFLVLMMWLLILDLGTKYFFFTLGWWTWRNGILPVFNFGISWSVKVPVLVSVLIWRISLLLFLLIYHQRYISRVVAALLMAWTLWNLIDRLYLGGVRDFIFVGNWFPIFNIADICLNAGILIFFWNEFFAWKTKSKQ